MDSSRKYQHLYVILPAEDIYAGQILKNVLVINHKSEYWWESFGNTIIVSSSLQCFDTVGVGWLTESAPGL